MNNEGFMVPRVEGPEEGFEIIPVPQADVSQYCAKRQVRGDQVQGICGREERRLYGNE